MTHRAQFAILLAVLAILAIYALWPHSAVGDVPVVASRIPASEFEAIGSAGSLSGLSTPGAPYRHELWDNGVAGTSSEPDTVPTDARLASPKAGVIVCGGLGHATKDDPGRVLGSSGPLGRAGSLLAVDGAQGQRLRSRFDGRTRSADVRDWRPPSGVDAGQRTTYSAGISGPAFVRQPAVLQPGALIAGYASGERYGQGSSEPLGEGWPPQPWRMESLGEVDRGSSGGDAPVGGLGDGSSSARSDVSCAPSDRGSHHPAPPLGPLAGIVSRTTGAAIGPTFTAAPQGALPGGQRPATPSPSAPRPVSVAPVSRHPVGRQSASSGVTPATGSTAPSVAGQASWFRSPRGVSAAGPALRTALGPNWRGSRVQVCGISTCITVILGDWCACSGRVIDLDDDQFSRLAPLSRGIVEVSVRW